VVRGPGSDSLAFNGRDASTESTVRQGAHLHALGNVRIGAAGLACWAGPPCLLWSAFGAATAVRRRASSTTTTIAVQLASATITARRS